MSGFDVGLTITGIQEAQRANARIIAALQPNSGLDRAVQFATTEAHRYAVKITHVDTGALRASHRMKSTGSARMEIYIDPNSANPRNKSKPSVYGFHEHNRGGSHAFYQRTVEERGDVIAQRAIAALQVNLP